MKVLKHTSIADYKSAHNIESLFAISCKNVFYAGGEPKLYLAGTDEFGAEPLLWCSEKAAEHLRDGKKDVEILTIEGDDKKEYSVVAPLAKNPAVAIL